MRELTQALPRGYLLDGYRIEKAIGGGGFSLVYLAYHIRTKSKVIIKEYFPSDMCSRIPGGKVTTNSEKEAVPFQVGIKRFFNEGMALSKLKHPNIVHVNNFFRTNSTVYMVMDYQRGRDLRWFIKRYRGRLSELFILTVFPKVLLGLSELHGHGFLHLDIKPPNILLRTGGEPLLLDFGAVQKTEPGMRYKGVQTLTHGFAPVEQYEEGAMGAWSDLYAIGASMYATITGKAPPPSVRRRKQDQLIPLSKSHSRKYSKLLLETIDWSLSLDYEQRPQTVEAFNEPLIEAAAAAASARPVIKELQEQD